MKSWLAIATVLLTISPLFAESRSVLVVVTHGKDGRAKAAVYSDDKQDRRAAGTVEEACKAIAGMKGWGSLVRVYVVTDQPMARKDRMAVFEAIDSNNWLDLSYYGPQAPRNLIDHFLSSPAKSGSDAKANKGVGDVYDDDLRGTGGGDTTDG